jgi:hypothetical protein
MPIQDRNLLRRRITRHIPFTAFLGSQVTGGSTVLDGFGTGAPVVSEVSTFGYGAFVLEQGDMLACLDFDTLMLADLSKEIGVRVKWIENEASPSATDDVTFIVLYDQADQGEALVEPATALDTAIANHEPAETVGLKLRRTQRGIINGGTFDANAKEGVLGWRIEADVVNGYSATVGFLALEIDYVPQLTRDADDSITVHTTRTDSETA